MNTQNNTIQKKRNGENTNHIFDNRLLSSSNKRTLQEIQCQYTHKYKSVCALHTHTYTHTEKPSNNNKI